MKYLQVVILTLFVIYVTAEDSSPKAAMKNPVVDERCMICLCEASTNCTENIQCQSGGRASVCGPYAISWAYWHDAGKPNDNGKESDPEMCMMNKLCSERSVRGYMSNYGQDCDGNGVIDCFDFARIHKMGPNQCSGDIQGTAAVYWNTFVRCFSRYDFTNIRRLGRKNQHSNRNFG